MNRVRMKSHRRIAERRHAAAVWTSVVYTLAAHAAVLRKAMGRIDHHDERLGITRPVGSWKA